VWNFGDKFRQRFLILPDGEGPKIATQDFGAEGVSDDAGSAAQLLLDLKQEPKEAGDCRVFV
jgi:hypothetical protein